MVNDATAHPASCSPLRGRLYAREDQHLLRKPSAADLDRRNGLGEFRDLGLRESHLGRADPLEEVRHLRRARDRHDPWLLREQPGERYLRGSRALPVAPCVAQLEFCDCPWMRTPVRGLQPRAANDCRRLSSFVAEHRLRDHGRIPWCGRLEAVIVAVLLAQRVGCALCDGIQPCR